MMKKWIISYQYWSIVFCPRELSEDIPQDWEVTDADSLAETWSTFTQGGHNIWVWTESMLDVAKFILSRHIYVKAAGGVVTNEDGEALLIYRNQHWDLPKGMMEPGETPSQCAIREVAEETGIMVDSINKLLLESFHVYNLYGGWHLKRTYWFEMNGRKQDTTPQTEEGITQCSWCDKQHRKQCLSESYAMMKLIDGML